MLEDDRDLAMLNERLLRRQGYQVYTAYTIEDAKKQLIARSPDLFILDVNLPDGNGMSFCREIRFESTAPILFLTGNTDTASKVKGLGFGGDYYLTKPYDKEELLAIIESLLRRVELFQAEAEEPTVLQCGALRLNVALGRAYLKDQDVGLTPKEFSLLRLLMQHQEKELPYHIIYENIWGAPMYDDSTALRKQLSRLKNKLRVDEFDDFSILNMQGKGYMFTSR